MSSCINKIIQCKKKQNNVHISDPSIQLLTSNQIQLLISKTQIYPSPFSQTSTHNYLLIMQAPNIPQVARKIKMFRKPSSNTSIESSQSPIVVRKKFVMERKMTSSHISEEKIQITDSISSKLKVCEGEKLSYEVMKGESKEKKKQFLQKYTNDPFMRRKFQKSVEKFSRSKQRQRTQKFMDPSHLQPDLSYKNNTLTTFREQIQHESKKTVKLINNCKELVEELKRNRLFESTKDSQIIKKNMYVSNKFQPLKLVGALTERV